MADNDAPVQGESKKPSFEKIVYSLRPSKSIERKMLAEAFQRLSVFDPLSDYRYIGFGSTYFADFSLFHKSLGITDMVSIEREEHKRERFEFNRPYRCIRLEFGESSAILPKLSWESRTILWLDYDGRLDHNMLSDVKHACASARSGSAIVVSVNAHPDEYNTNRLQKLVERLGEEKVPIDVKKEDLSGWGTATVCSRIVVNEIRETLRARNGVLSADDSLQFKQLFNFHYQDGTKMLTVGGLLVAQNECDLVPKCSFEQLPFVRTVIEPYLIAVPCLTYRELRHLDRMLPQCDAASLDCPKWLPSEDVKKYAAVYRYFPLFAETEL